MNKKEFLHQLKEELNGIKDEKLEDILEDYEEHFEEAIKDGKSEEEISKDLGNPKSIAKDLKIYAVVEKAEKNFSFKNTIRVIGTFLSLGIFNFIFIFPYLCVVGVLLGIAVISVVLFFGGIGGLLIQILTLITGYSSFFAHGALQTFFYSLLAIGGGLLLGTLDFFAIKSFYKFTIKYIKMNIKLVKEKD